MAALAIGAAGAALGSWLAPAGFTLFGLTGAQIGFSVGSTIGSLLFGPNTDLPTQHGPRLNDLKVQVSSYGAMLPFGWGSFRSAGVVIWSGGIREVATYNTVETGKGGGGSTQTQVSYSYYMDVAVAFHDGEVDGIRKIWANGELIYNVGEDASGNTVLASNEFAAGVTVYTGSETQDPDSLIESYLGAGNVPGYRGTAYVVFRDLLLDKFGRRLPNFEFEVVANGATISLGTQAYVNGTNATTNAVLAATDITDAGRALYGEVWAIHRTPNYNAALYSLYSAAQVTTAGAVALGGASGSTLTQIAGVDALNRAYTRVSGTARLSRIDRNGTVLYVTPATGIGQYGVAISADAETIWGMDSAGSAQLYRLTNLNWGAHTCTQTTVTGATLSRLLRNALGIEGRLYGVTGLGLIRWVDTETLAVTTWSSIGSIVSTHGGVIGPDGYLYIPTTNTLGKYDLDGTLVDSVTITGITDVQLADSNGYVWALTATTARKVLAATMTVESSASISAAGYTAIVAEFTAGVPVVWGNNVNTAGRIGIIEPLERISAGAATLDDVVEQLCVRGGLAAADVDVTDLAATTVRGYVVGRRGPVRGMIEPLMAAYFFDAVESDGKIRFVKRGASAVRALSEDRLGARNDDSDEASEPVLLTRRQDLELPKQINLVFMDAANHYQPGEQSGRRLVETSLEPRTVELPLVLQPGEARAIAETMLYVLWLARTGATFAGGREQLALDAADVVTVPHGGETYTVRLLRTTQEPFGACGFEAELEQADIYSRTVAGVDSTEPDGEVALTAPTEPLFLDLPLLRDVDDAPGFYFAALGYGEDWTGVQLHVAADGSIYAPAANGALLASSTAGAAVTALANLTAHGNELIDEHNTVDILLAAGTLASVTRAQLLNGANAAVLLGANGPELLQFRDAALVATDTWRLSGLLRGRIGSEAAMDGHAIGDRFVLLNAEIRDIPQNWSLVNRALSYKAVSVGSTLQRTPAVSFSNTALRMRPLAPVQLGGGRDGSGNLLLTWKRRTRLAAGLRDNVDAPLGEASERYQVDIYDGADVVRTLDATSAAATYSAADQTTDFGSPQASLAVAVVQLSETYGRGAAASGTF